MTSTLGSRIVELLELSNREAAYDVDSRGISVMTAMSLVGRLKGGMMFELVGIEVMRSVCNYTGELTFFIK